MNEPAEAAFADVALAESLHESWPALHAAVRDGAYWIMVPGNKHLARTPPLGDFDLALRLGIVAPNINDPCPFHRFGFRVFFRYDPFLKQGYRLTGRLAGRRLELQLETVDARDETGAVAAGAADLPPAFEASDFSASLSARGSQFVFSTAGVTVGSRGRTVTSHANEG